MESITYRKLQRLSAESLLKLIKDKGTLTVNVDGSKLFIINGIEARQVDSQASDVMNLPICNPSLKPGDKCRMMQFGRWMERKA